MTSTKDSEKGALGYGKMTAKRRVTGVSLMSKIQV